MAEYIKREALMNEIHRIGGHNLCGWDTIGVKALVDRQPTADVVEVVRCKDCRNFGEDVGMSKDGVWARCFLHKRILCENDFCSYGERRLENEPT